jgi:hypothetical protein
LHLRNPHLQSIVRDFVSFYYNGEVSRTKYLLSAAKAVFEYTPMGRILSQLHVEMAKSDQLKSFETFRLFNEVKRQMSDIYFKSYLEPAFKKPFEELKEKAPACMRQLLWPEDTTEFQVVNKFFNATLSVQEDSSVVCFTLGDKRSNQTWIITVDEVTSLLTLTHEQKKLELGAGKESSPSLAQTGEGWMAKAVDEHHFKIYHTSQGEKLNLNLVYLVSTFFL